MKKFTLPKCTKIHQIITHNPGRNQQSNSNYQTTCTCRVPRWMRTVRDIVVPMGTLENQQQNAEKETGANHPSGFFFATRASHFAATGSWWWCKKRASQWLRQGKPHRRPRRKQKTVRPIPFRKFLVGPDILTTALPMYLTRHGL